MRAIAPETTPRSHLPEPRTPADEPRPARALGALLEPRVVAGVLLALAAVAALQEWLLGPKEFGGRVYTHINNFHIYAQAFRHLVRGEDLYAFHPLEHWDKFKYSPSFAALMAPFAAIPPLAGVVLWNLLNAAALVLALAKLPGPSPRSRALLGWFLLPEFLTSAQNVQVNVLLAALVVLAFAALENARPAWAALLAVAGFFVKIYPALAVLLFLLYPRKRRLLAWSAAWLVALGAIPLLLVPFDRFRACYASWLRLLSFDRTALTGLSVMQVLHAFFHLDPPRTLVSAVGLVLLVVPLARVRAHRDARFRLLFVASLLVWMVIFNHTAESATFVLAACGVGIWYFAHPRGVRDHVLLGLTFLLTSMSPRLPRWLVVQVVEPYALKAVPCILVWLAISWELTTGEFSGGALGTELLAEGPPEAVEAASVAS